MLVKSLKVPPSILAFIAFCVFLGWTLSHGPGEEVSLGDSAGFRTQTEPPPPPPPEEHNDEPPPPPPEGEVEKDPESKGPRVALVTFITDEKSYIHISLKSKDHYARRHGYDLIVDYEAHTDRSITYWKFDMMERLLKKDKWDWIWWLDFDTLVTNTDIKVTDVIEETLKNATNPDEVDYLVTHDCNGLNTGSFIVRGHERSIKFLQDIYHTADKEKEGQSEHDLSEQDAMAKLINDNEEARSRTIQVPQWKLNAFPQEIACFDESKKVWKHGDFVVHFAGAWAHIQDDDPTGLLMRKYQKEIIWGDWKTFH